MADLTSLLELQLSEIELLGSMFPGQGELVLDDPATVADVRQYVDGQTDTPPAARLEFTVNLKLQEPQQFSIQCSFPHDYPEALPDISIWTSCITRQGQSQLNLELSQYLQTLPSGELYVNSVLEWVQDNVSRFLGPVSPTKEISPANAASTTFARYWIYSHHIQSKFKRRDLNEWAGKLAVTGFYLPGKPGIICVEGGKERCEEYWKWVRELNWKKISLRHHEETEIADGQTVDGLRKFQGFGEKVFGAHNFHGRNFHMDLGEFYQFLKEHQCETIYAILFGIEGKSTES
ncbi:RWDD2B [Branchiostoma lanceolatum]|uniref:RWDD2B protein n=1 Tax=Branchiostoma lanceolatum TaxID=7740 RepID=A0A8J9ZV54_BRALA|nr:RWDD2B [Branchiostoma lanceolatum]